MIARNRRILDPWAPVCGRPAKSFNRTGRPKHEPQRAQSKRGKKRDLQLTLTFSGLFPFATFAYFASSAFQAVLRPGTLLGSPPASGWRAPATARTASPSYGALVEPPSAYPTNVAAEGSSVPGEAPPPLSAPGKGARPRRRRSPEATEGAPAEGGPGEGSQEGSPGFGAKDTRPTRFARAANHERPFAGGGLVEPLTAAPGAEYKAIIIHGVLCDPSVDGLAKSYGSRLRQSSPRLHRQERKD